MRRGFRGARAWAAAGVFLSLATWSACAATGRPEPDAAERRESASRVSEEGPTFGAGGPAEAALRSEVIAAPADAPEGGAVCMTEDGAPFESESC
ncbi:hypothetical protein [Sorangium sp. So ce861]|uniref:hypothetical protein n=1 Tax=Sorangium sp. So ce861 TaxID=3133323 RepID=UPI003F5F2D93